MWALGMPLRLCDLLNLSGSVSGAVCLQGCGLWVDIRQKAFCLGAIAAISNPTRISCIIGHYRSAGCDYRYESPGKSRRRDKP